MMYIRIKSVIAISLLLLACSKISTASPNYTNDTIKIVTSTNTYNLNVEIAKTKEQRSHGLMNRKTLGKVNGMLFIYPKNSIIKMWMKNTLIPLDMLFISDSGVIVEIITNTTPFDLTPLGPDIKLRGVLEVPAGTAKSLNIKIGSLVDYKFFN